MSEAVSKHWTINWPSVKPALQTKNVVQLTVAVVAEDMAEAELDRLSGAVVGLTCS